MYSLEQAKQRAFDRCNREGEDCQIYNILYQYKAIRELPDEMIEEIYDDIAYGLGFYMPDKPAWNW